MVSSPSKAFRRYDFYHTFDSKPFDKPLGRLPSQIAFVDDPSLAQNLVISLRKLIEDITIDIQSAPSSRNRDDCGLRACALHLGFPHPDSLLRLLPSPRLRISPDVGVRTQISVELLLLTLGQGISQSRDMMRRASICKDCR